MKQQPEILDILVDLKVAVSSTRKSILDVLQAAYGGHQNWPYIRSAVLRILGKSGLEGAIERIQKMHEGIFDPSSMEN